METIDGQGSLVPEVEPNTQQQWPPPQPLQEIPQLQQVTPQPLQAPLQWQQAPQMMPYPSQPPAIKLPKPTLADTLYALVLLILGFCFWDWGYECWLLGSGFGTSVLFLSGIIASFVYMQVKGIKQNNKSLLMLLVAIAGSLPFALYGQRGINPCLILVESALCLTWVMYSCRTSISQKLSGLFAGDLLNQVFVVPFANFSRFFTRPFEQLSEKGKGWMPVLFAVLGVIVCIPVLAIVISLLSGADDGFRVFVEDFSKYFEKFDLPQYIFQLILGIPVAAYVFGAVLGNVFQRHTAHLSAKGLLDAFGNAHALPRAAVYLPLVLFVLLYIIFFIAMGSYLFSGLRGELPVVYTYAEYARQGFFQLCAVATINLVILGLIWLFAKRSPSEYPPALRALSSLLALLTCLLIVTAASKMLLYIQTYSLTPLRVYTSWFMLLMFVAFLLLLAWHVKPFNVARPIIALILIFTLGLGLANTNKMIADYNVDRYLSGQTDKIDVSLLWDLGDPALPALYRLEKGAEDPEIRKNATEYIEWEQDAQKDFSDIYDYGLTTWGGWQSKNLQSLKAEEYFKGR